MEDNFLIVNPETIEEAIELIQKNCLTLKIEWDLHDFLSCEIKILDDKKKVWLAQPYVTENLRKERNGAKTAFLEMH